MSEIRDKDGVPIHVGDYVKTKTRQGQVQAVFSNDASTPAEKSDDAEITVTVKHPPKVVLLDQKGAQFSHNPSVLSHTSQDGQRVEESDTDVSESAQKDERESSGGAEGGRTLEYHSEGEALLHDKNGLPIHVGETVMTRYRGGTREGKVEAIFTNTSKSPAEEEPGHEVHVSVVNPPKVIFTTQRDKQVAHNPSTLSHVE